MTKKKHDSQSKKHFKYQNRTTAKIRQAMKHWMKHVRLTEIENLVSEIFISFSIIYEYKTLTKLLIYVKSQKLNLYLQ